MTNLLLLSLLTAAHVDAVAPAVITSDPVATTVPAVPVMTHMPSVLMPRDFIKRCVTAKVTFEFTILESGYVDDVVITSPPSEYDKMVYDKVRVGWRATPYKSDALVRKRSYINFDPCSGSG